MNNMPAGPVLNRTLNESLRLEDVSLSRLELVRYNSKVETSSESGITSYGESFPWLVDEEGNMIDLSKSIRLFDGVKLISNYLEKKYEMDKNLISEVKITELLELFKNKEEVTVYQLYAHVANLYNADKGSFKTSIVKNLSTAEDLNIQDIVDINNISKPFGTLGDISLNQIATNLKDLKWDLILNKTEITINALPTAVNLISYSLILKSYMKHIHNRPYPKNISAVEREIQVSSRNRQLALFAVLGAPMAIIFLRSVAISLKDMVSINYSLDNSTDKVIDSKSGLFLLWSNLNKKVHAFLAKRPWLKLIFKLLLFIIIVIKLLGIGIIEFLNSMYYLKIYSYFSCSLGIIYQLTNLYLLHKACNKDMKISEVLPDFMIKRLKEFEILSSSKDSIIEFKKDCYIHLCIYTVILIIILII